jgi:hypothetical protein
MALWQTGWGWTQIWGMSWGFYASGGRRRGLRELKQDFCIKSGFGSLEVWPLQHEQTKQTPPIHSGKNQEAALC